MFRHFTTTTTRYISKRLELKTIDSTNTSRLKKKTYDQVKLAISTTSIESFGMREEVNTAIAALGVKRPSPIQLLAIPEILAGKNLLCAGETGSGKTLMYLTPIISKLRDEEISQGLLRRVGHPRGLIVVPSKELVKQVENVGKSLGHRAKFQIRGIYDRIPKYPDLWKGTVDIVVTTPKKLFYYIESGLVSLEEVRHLVIDEADTLFDKDFAELTGRIRSSVKAASPKCQEIFSSATIPAKLHAAVEKDRFLQIVSPRLHRTVKALKQRFIELSGHGDNKQQALLKVLTELPPRDHRTMIFCNTLGSCRSLEAWLAGVPELKDICGETSSVKAYHSRVPKELRNAILKRFDDGSVNTLICTDIASRGLDTLKVKHVIMYDFPYSAADYLHRVGRTARVEREGKATSLVSKRDMELAARIQKAIKLRKPIS